MIPGDLPVKAKQLVDALKNADREFFHLLDRADLECIRKIARYVKEGNLAKILPSEEGSTSLTMDDFARMQDISRTLNDYKFPTLAARIKQYASLYFADQPHEKLVDRIYNDLKKDTTINPL